MDLNEREQEKLRDTIGTFSGPATSRCTGLFERESEPREAIVEGVIHATNGALIGPGGVSKTTLSIREGMHLVLARDVWMRRVLRPGPVLFITGEDSKADFEYRLQRIADAMHLTPTERKRVADGIFVEDVSDRIARFAELDHAGNIVMTDRVDELCALYAGEGLAMVNIDPMVFFGAGERLTNDAEAAMNQVTKRLARYLNAHVRVVHHTGKQVAREGIADQYAGRGGSALADNARQMMQVLPGPDKQWKLPPEALELAQVGWEPLRVHFHKVSYDKKPAAPVWVVRHGWAFIEFDGAKKQDETGRRVTDMCAIQKLLTEQRAMGVYVSRSKLENYCEELQLKRARVRVLVEQGLQLGELIEAEAPPELARGAFKTYLKPGLRPGTAAE